MASSDSQIDKPQRGRPKRAELPDVNINIAAQSINTERAEKTEAVSSAVHDVRLSDVSDMRTRHSAPSYKCSNRLCVSRE